MHSTAFAGGITEPTPSAYWTTPVPSVDTRIVYVSSSGNNANSGLSEALPKQTVAAGLALMRNGFPDWLLIKRGDTFTGGITWSLSGRSASEPMIVGTYGTGVRPVLRCGTGNGFRVSGAGVTRNYFKVLGIDFYAQSRDPSFTTPAAPSATSNEGLSWRAASLGAVFEDCVFRWFRDNINIQCTDSPSLPTHVQLRRCLSTDAWSDGVTHSQGGYIYGVTSLTVDECISIHNGWHETNAGAAGTIFNHNWYIANGNLGVVFTNNITLQASSHGLQLRCGGTMTGNYSDKNAIGLLFGGGSDPNITFVTGDASDNVICNGTNIGGDSGANKQYGIDLQNNATVNSGPIDYRALVGVTCNRNVIANALNGSANLAIPTGPSGVTYGSGADANIKYNWPVGSNMGSYADPTRDLAKYAGTLGYTATLAGAIAQLRLQRRDAWNDNLTAQAINTYVRAGFV